MIQQKLLWRWSFWRVLQMSLENKSRLPTSAWSNRAWCDTELGKDQWYLVNVELWIIARHGARNTVLFFQPLQFYNCGARQKVHVLRLIFLIKYWKMFENRGYHIEYLATCELRFDAWVAHESRMNQGQFSFGLTLTSSSMARGLGERERWSPPPAAPRFRLCGWLRIHARQIGYSGVTSWNCARSTLRSNNFIT